MQVNSEENDRHKEAVYEILNRNPDAKRKPCYLWRHLSQLIH